MKRRLRVAIIGAGMIANAGHIPAWKNLPEEVEVVGVANIHEERAIDTAKRHEIPHAYGDWQRMLADLRPDIVSICTPNVSHKELAIGALQAGAHVLCEKPVAACYADAVEMFATADAVGRALFVAQTSRFSNEMEAAKEIASSGQLGEMYYAETSALRRRGIPTWGRFHMREYSGGGPILDLGVHVLDALYWIMGNPRAIAVSSMTYAKLANRDEGLVSSLADSGAPVGVYNPRAFDYREVDVEDMAAGLIRLENNATVSFKTSWAANVPEGIGATIILGTKGGLRLWPLTLVSNLGRYQVDVTPHVSPDPAVPFFGHWRLAEHVVKVLRGEAEPLVKREEVLNVMRTLDGLYRSASEGREVWLG